MCEGDERLSVNLQNLSKYAWYFKGWTEADCDNEVHCTAFNPDQVDTFLLWITYGSIVLHVVYPEDVTTSAELHDLVQDWKIGEHFQAESYQNAVVDRIFQLKGILGCENITQCDSVLQFAEVADGLGRLAIDLYTQQDAETDIVEDTDKVGNDTVARAILRAAAKKASGKWSPGWSEDFCVAYHHHTHTPKCNGDKEAVSGLKRAARRSSTRSNSKIARTQ